MDESAVKLLVADADASVRDIVLYSLGEQGWLVDGAKDGVSAIKLLRRNRYQMLILDLDLPIIDGLTVCEQFCADTPVIFVSRRDAEQDRLDAFAAGGNDFLHKPFYPRELVARVKSLLGLIGAYRQKGDVLRAGVLHFMLGAREVSVADKPVKLTPREYDLLLFLARNEDRCFSRESLLNMVWGQQFDGSNRTVDTHIKSLREKLRPFHTHIATVWGVGYKFSAR